MHTKKSNNSKSQKSSISNTTVSVYSFAFILLFISLLTELLTTESFFSYVFNAECPIFIQAPAIFEIIKVVGLSNVIVAWIYVNSDKTMLGLSYLDILNSYFPRHGVFSVIHFASTLICISVSSSGLSESSIISLAIVLWGLIYQFYVFYCIFLNSLKCENIAKIVWKQESKNFPTLHSKLLCLTGTFPTNDSKQYRAYLTCFSSLFVENLTLTSECNWIKQNYQIWENLLMKCEKIDSTFVLEIFVELFNQLIQFKKTSTNTFVNKSSVCVKCLSALISGYVTFVILKIKRENLSNDNFSHKYWGIIKDVETITQYLYEQTDKKYYGLITDAYNCIQTNLYLTAWVLFQEDHMKLTKQIVMSKPSLPNDTYFNEMINVIFPEHAKNQEYLEELKDIAKSQLS